MKQWRRAVSHEMGTETRALRIAWLLSNLFRLEGGFSNMSDGRIATETNVPIKHVSPTLAALEERGAIIRAHVVNAGGITTQRRIWPAAAIVGDTAVPPTAGGATTPHAGKEVPPTVGGQNRDSRRAGAREGGMETSTMAAARREAEMRERINRGG